MKTKNEPRAAGEAAHTPKVKTYQQPDWKGWYKLTRVTVVEIYGTPPTTPREANELLAHPQNNGVSSFKTETATDEHLIAEFPKEVIQ